MNKPRSVHPAACRAAVREANLTMFVSEKRRAGERGHPARSQGHEVPQKARLSRSDRNQSSDWGGTERGLGHFWDLLDAKGADSVACGRRAHAPVEARRRGNLAAVNGLSPGKAMPTPV